MAVDPPRSCDPLIPRDGGGALTDLHDGVVHKDRAAWEALAKRALPLLHRLLRSAFRRADDDVLWDAAEDAFMDYARSSERQNFDPSSVESLDRFLYRAAWRNVANSLRNDLRRRRREARYAEEAARQKTPGTLTERSVRIGAEMIRRILEGALDNTERGALGLWLHGERRTASLARALGVDALPVRQQRREVKRFKDRNRCRICRLLRVTQGSRWSALR